MTDGHREEYPENSVSVIMNKELQNVRQSKAVSKQRIQRIQRIWQKSWEYRVGEVIQYERLYCATLTMLPSCFFLPAPQGFYTSIYGVRVRVSIKIAIC